MKTTICAEELRELDACEAGYNTFCEAHGESVVKLSEALESNGLNDVFWLLELLELTKRQEDDLHLLACTYAEAVLPIFEEVYPNDNRPRKAIEAKRAWVAGKVSDEELKAARAAASEAAKEAACGAASAAASAVAWAAASEAASGAAWAAGWAAARAAARDKQKEQLGQVLISWENKV